MRQNTVRFFKGSLMKNERVGKKHQAAILPIPRYISHKSAEIFQRKFFCDRLNTKNPNTIISLAVLNIRHNTPPHSRLLNSDIYTLLKTAHVQNISRKGLIFTPALTKRTSGLIQFYPYGTSEYK